MERKMIGGMSIRGPQEAKTYVKGPKPVKLQKAPMGKKITKRK